MKVKFNVLVPNYNNAPFLDECLTSILSQQTNFVFHVLINDDNSTDNSIEIINKYMLAYPTKITLFQNTKNLNLLATIYTLYNNTNSDYFCVLDGDDYWVDNYFLQRAADLFDTHKSYTIYSEKTKLFNNKTKEYDDVLIDCHTSATAFRGYFDAKTMLTIQNIISIDDNNLIHKMNEHIHQGDSFRNYYFSTLGSKYINNSNCSGCYRINIGGNQQWQSLDIQWRIVLNCCLNITLNHTLNLENYIDIKSMIYTLNSDSILFYKNNYYLQNDIDAAIKYYIDIYEANIAYNKICSLLFKQQIHVLKPILNIIKLLKIAPLEDS